ncbi:MAG: outer membrane protein transport protein [Acinetobacter sp.]
MLNAMNKVAIRALLPLVSVSSVYAAGLERSSQQVDALFESGTYAEIGMTHIVPKVTGKDIDGHSISDIAEDTQSYNYAVKTDLSPSLRLALFFDEPYGAKVKFEGDNNFVAHDFPTSDANTRVEVKSKNVTTLLGYNLNKNVMIYAGPALQEVTAETHLRGKTYGKNSGYNMTFDDIAVGWVAGMSYAKPELGVLASLTYRSEIEHESTVHEDVPLADIVFAGNYSHANKGGITTPESVNLNMQTGLNQTTSLYAKVRWVPWSDFAYYPPVLKAATQAAVGRGLPLANYHDDQTAVEIGVGKRLNSNLAISVSGSWDSGSGNPAPTLGPIQGYWGVGLAAKYNINKNVAFSLGGRYMWFGDAKGEVSDGRIVGDFQDNTGYAIGMKLSYKSK